MRTAAGDSGPVRAPLEEKPLSDQDQGTTQGRSSASLNRTVLCSHTCVRIIHLSTWYTASSHTERPSTTAVYTLPYVIVCGNTAGEAAGLLWQAVLTLNVGNTKEPNIMPLDTLGAGGSIRRGAGGSHSPEFKGGARVPVSFAPP